MQFEGEITLNASPEEVWETISDPSALVSCIPGAEDIQRVTDDEYEGTIVQRVAGYDLRIKGSVERVEVNPYESMVAIGKGSDKRAGKWTNAEGRAEMKLNETATGTNLQYTVDAEISGRLASLGARLLKPKINADIESFFENIQEHIEE